MRDSKAPDFFGVSDAPMDPPMMQDAPVYTAIGTMAGTSLDGVDIALLKTDGETIAEMGPTSFVPYEGKTRALIIQATKAALEGRFEAQDIIDAGKAVTEAHIDALRAFLDKERLTAAEIDLIGFHGQTILHRPSRDGSVGHTWQIGGPGMLAEALGIDTVGDFRAADVAEGGEGAPLAPIYHQALAKTLDREDPVLLVNIGGVANVTYVSRSRAPSELIAFDCGPGNGLIDQWVEQKAGRRMDDGGKLAFAGTVDEAALKLMCLNPYLKRVPPKSLDRYDFKLGAVSELSLEDGAATLTAFTAEAIARTLDILPEAPSVVVICGGGRHNPAMMAALNERVDALVKTAEDLGWRGDFIEAEAFALLAARSLRGLPMSFPKTTRAPRAMTGGTLYPAPR